MKPTRRGILGALAGAATISWLARDRAVADAGRVWAGAPVRLRFAEADAFALTFSDGHRATIAAPSGDARFFAPDPPVPGLYVLTCTPLRAGRPCGAAAQVEVVRTRRVFGA